MINRVAFPERVRELLLYCCSCLLAFVAHRYQLYLQVKQDILQGRLPVSFELAAELGAYVVQGKMSLLWFLFSQYCLLHGCKSTLPAELGDYDPRKHPLGYVSEFRLLNNQTKEIESRIHELHMQLKGMAPSQAEFNYLDKVKWHDMYGVDLHPVLVSVAGITVGYLISGCFDIFRVKTASSTTWGLPRGAS